MVKKEYSSWEEWKARSWRNRNQDKRPKLYETNMEAAEKRRKIEEFLEVKSLNEQMLLGEEI